jgi:hypothetical protein
MSRLIVLLGRPRSLLTSTPPSKSVHLDIRATLGAGAHTSTLHLARLQCSQHSRTMPDLEIGNMFRHWKQVCITSMKSAGSYDVKIHWGSPDEAPCQLAVLNSLTLHAQQVVRLRDDTFISVCCTACRRARRLTVKSHSWQPGSTSVFKPAKPHRY